MSESETANTDADAADNDSGADSAVVFENAGAIEEAVEQEHERQEERHEEAREAHEDEQAILDAIQRDTVTTRLKGRPMEFQTLLGSTETFIENAFEKFGPGGEFTDVDDPDDLPDGAQAEMNAFRQKIRDILAENNVDDDKYDRGFWADVPDEYCFETLSQIREGGEETDRAGN